MYTQGESVWEAHFCEGLSNENVNMFSTTENPDEVPDKFDYYFILFVTNL